MKKFTEVEQTRRAYHAFPERDSVHRAAAIFPIADSARYRSSLSLLNHWKIKRGIPEVAARHTLRDGDGQRLGQVYGLLDGARAYDFALEEVAEAAGLDATPGAGTWEVEFFAARNMFIPYPAVIMNTAHDGFFNQVHAYARTLSDVAEAAPINRVPVAETSIDVVVGDGRDTFVEVINGPAATDSELVFTLADQAGGCIERRRPFRRPGYGTDRVRLSELFGEALGASRLDRTLFVSQPPMEGFFSRLFGGVVSTTDGAFSANHSYYDNRGTDEYWIADPAHAFHSALVLPLFDGLDLTLRLYPIACPAALDYHLALYAADGRAIETRREIGHTGEGDSAILELPLGAIGRAAGARSAELLVTPAGAGGRVPMRIAFQVCYGSGAGLASSINMSMLSPYVFYPEGKTGRGWCEVAGAAEVDNRIGFCHTAPFPDTGRHAVTATLYRCADDACREAAVELAGKQAWADDLDTLFPDYKEFLGSRNGFLYLDSPSQFLRCLSVQTHRVSGHSAGEHGF